MWDFSSLDDKELNQRIQTAMRCIRKGENFNSAAVQQYYNMLQGLQEEKLMRKNRSVLGDQQQSQIVFSTDPAVMQQIQKNSK